MKQSLFIKDKFSLDYFLNKADELIKEYKYEDAIEIYTNCNRHYPNCLRSFNNLAILLNERLEFKKAIKILQSAICKFPKSAFLYRNIGILYYEKGFEFQAYNCFSKSLKISPNFADSYFNQANVLSGWSRLDKTNYEKALNYYYKSIKLDPYNYLYYSNLASLYLHFNNYIKALKYYKRAIIIEPSIEFLYKKIGIIYSNLKFSNKSIKSYNNIKSNQFFYRCSTVTDSTSITNEELAIKVENISINKDLKFIPSYLYPKKKFGYQLIYTHIPKCGGTRFQYPLQNAIKTFYSKKTFSLFSRYLNDIDYPDPIQFILLELENNIEYNNSLIDKINNLQINNINFSLITSYLFNSNPIYNKVIEKISKENYFISSYRNPEDRLNSALKHLLRNNQYDYNIVKDYIIRRDPFLDNSIYRSIYNDYDFIPNQSHYKTRINCLLDIDNIDSIDKFQSNFISSLLLPNLLIQDSIHNSTIDNDCQQKLLKKLYNECLLNDFIKYDKNIEKNNFNKLTSFFFDSPVSDKSYIHPLTIILNTNTSSYFNSKSTIVPTSYLIQDSGQLFLERVFN